MRKFLVFPSTVAKQHYDHVPQFQRLVNTTNLSFIMTTSSCGDNLVLERGKDGTTQIFPSRLISQWCYRLAVQLLASLKVQACQRKEEMTEPYLIYTSVLSQDS